MLENVLFLRFLQQRRQREISPVARCGITFWIVLPYAPPKVRSRPPLKQTRKLLPALSHSAPEKQLPESGRVEENSR